MLKLEQNISLLSFQVFQLWQSSILFFIFSLSQNSLQVLFRPKYQKVQICMNIMLWTWKFATSTILNIYSNHIIRLYKIFDLVKLLFIIIKCPARSIMFCSFVQLFFLHTLQRTYINLKHFISTAKESGMNNCARWIRFLDLGTETFALQPFHHW